MASIQPVNLSTFGIEPGRFQAAAAPGGAGISNGDAGINPAGSLGSSAAVGDLGLQMSQLLEDLGRGFEDNRALMALIALLLVLALVLEELRQPQPQAGLLQGLGDGGRGYSASYTAFSISTVLQVYQSTTTIVTVNMSGGSVPGGEGPAPTQSSAPHATAEPMGGQLDVSI